MGLSRRAFLQQTGLALLTLGITEKFLEGYAQALAQSTNRKLALLIGIDQYRQNAPLKGCKTDVELQKELLIYRFGFKPQDIVTLTDQQATRENIETTFSEHLIAQANPSDVVVFHYSGYGTRIGLSNSTISPPAINLVDSFVPVDGVIPTKAKPASNYLLKDTLLLLARALNTDKLTLVLDTGYQKAIEELQGNLRIRALPHDQGILSLEAIAAKEQLQTRYNQQLKPRKRKFPPGTLLSAANSSTIAVERQWQDFSAGVLTYALTQHLWETAENYKIQVIFNQVKQKINRDIGKLEQPVLITEKKPTLTYYSPLLSNLSAEGVIIEVNPDNTGKVFLGGFAPLILVNNPIGSCFTVFAANAEILIQLNSLQGITGTFNCLNPPGENTPAVGNFIQEKIRVLPRHLGLNIALGEKLERIERVDATSAFANVNSVANVINRGEQHIDYIIGKIESQDKTEKFLAYSLFSPLGEPLSKTIGKTPEAVKVAVTRLTPKLDNLLAFKWFNCLDNQATSRLPVKVSMTVTDKLEKELLTVESLRGSQLKSLQSSSSLSNLPISALLNSEQDDKSIPTIAKNTEITYQITNKSKVPIYLLIFNLDKDSQNISFYLPEGIKSSEPKTIPTNSQNFIESSLAPNQTIKFPYTNISVGKLEGRIIASIRPFVQTWQEITENQNLPATGQIMVNLTNPLNVVRGILKDIHNASQVPAEIIDSKMDVYALDLDSWASLSLYYEAIET